ncbi:hypothetical protein CP967_31320 [Streptomyces nitrosporeus]|uniref:Uncharacterized protein n=2 Tax=Streptomyces nitrosporeus TaxID=28894 RepID=A0A5J6FLW7_9ACTN|nr:hypothetical protein CP967_31320 [Streptomyces nitrosporeus]
MVEVGHFYRDKGGDIYQAVTPLIVQFVAFGHGDPDVEPFDVVPLDRASDAGDLVEVRPTGWEAV